MRRPIPARTVAEAQRDVRTVFMNGAVGQLVSGLIWAAGAAAATAGSLRWAILLVVGGGVLIFPVTQLVLRVLRRPAGLPRGHPMNGLAMQVAFIVPLLIPVAGAAALYRVEWFFPALMAIVGAHYLPFVFLYGMPAFGVLGAVLMGAGVALAFWPAAPIALAPWLTAAALLAFGALAALRGRAEAMGPAAAPARAGPGE